MVEIIDQVQVRLRVETGTKVPFPNILAAVQQLDKDLLELVSRVEVAPTWFAVSVLMSKTATAETIAVLRTMIERAFWQTVRAAS